MCSWPQVRAALDAVTDFCALKNTINALPYSAGWTATWDGITAGTTQVRLILWRMRVGGGGHTVHANTLSASVMRSC